MLKYKYGKPGYFGSLMILKRDFFWQDGGQTANGARNFFVHHWILEIRPSELPKNTNFFFQSKQLILEKKIDHGVRYETIYVACPNSLQSEA